MSKQLNVVPRGECALEVARHFAAPRARVWHAFTTAELLQKWLLGPPGWQMIQCDLTPQTGGRYDWTWRNAATGERFGFTGTYASVVEGAQMVDRQTFHQGDPAAPLGATTVNAVLFDDAGAGTRVTTHILYPDAATRDMALDQGLETGMALSYTRLDGVLAKQDAPQLQDAIPEM